MQEIAAKLLTGARTTLWYSQATTQDKQWK